MKKLLIIEGSIIVIGFSTVLCIMDSPILDRLQILIPIVVFVPCILIMGYIRNNNFVWKKWYTIIIALVWCTTIAFVYAIEAMK